MRHVDVDLTNRFAYIFRANRKTLKRLDDFWSFSTPGAYFAPQYKLYVRERARAIEEGEPNRKVLGWDGKTRFLKHTYDPARLSAGLFRATRKAAEEKLGIKFDVSYDRPGIKKFLPGFVSETKEYLYQNACVDAMCKNVDRGGGIVLAATGSGKTKIAAQFFSKLKYECLFIVDTIDLLYQTQKELGSWLNEPIGVIGNQKYAPARITVATIQTLNRHIKDKKFMLWYRRVKIMIVDELHEQMSRRNWRVTEHVDPIAVFGLTATLQLGQKNVRYKACAFAGPVVYSFSVKKGMDTKVLSRGYMLQLLFPPINPADDYHDAEQRYEEEMFENSAKLKSVRRMTRYLIAAERYVLILADRIAHVKTLHTMFADIPHGLAYGGVSKEKRRMYLRRFEVGKIKLIIASRVFKKGINIKRLDAMIDMAERPGKNDAMQKFGRGVRKHIDKKFLLYIDVGTATDPDEEHSKLALAARSRARALRKAGIRVTKVNVDNAQNAVRAVKRALKRGRKQYAQMELGL